MRRPLVRLAIVWAAASLAAAPVFAQTRDEIRQRDEQLYQQSQDQSYANPTAPPLGGDDSGAPLPQRSGGAGGLTAQLLDRVTTLEGQVRTLQGRVDELQNELQTRTAGLSKQIGDLSFAVQQGAGHASAPAAAPDEAAPTFAGPAPRAAGPPVAATPAHLTPEIALRQANAALAHHDYAAAADLARQAAGAGGGVHASQAQYVLGEALAGQGNNGGAAASYYTAYTKQPRGPFAADALLHVGSSLIATGDTNAACEALGQFRASFPTARPGLLKQAAALRARARCH